MKEDFLHYIWKFKRINPNDLITAKGEPILVLNPGIHNFDSGPDFSNARLKIGDTVWAGNVEIHVNSSDWFAHKHQFDNAYNNVILHVVYNHDKEVPLPNGISIPHLELKGKIPKKLQHNYENLISNGNWIPCEQSIKDKEQLQIPGFYSNLLIERLMEKGKHVGDVVSSTNNDWEQTLYELLTANFGLKVNVTPMRMLSKELPLKILRKHLNNPRQIEALLFGTAGFLNQSFEEDYPEILRKEFSFLQKKYKLKPIDLSLWRFGRMMPGNLPTIRLAQVASLIAKKDFNFSGLISSEISQFKTILETSAFSYWENHYHFNKTTVEHSAKIGGQKIDNVIINVIVPVLFEYGVLNQKQAFKEKALSLLESIKPENNVIIRGFKKIGFEARSAFETQSLLQLKNHYCNNKKCVNCTLGNKIMQIYE
ncbi:MAG: hypothetical protein ACJATA_000954 [Sphingobacteriales bacterium]|jgi:hypothetical protein